MPPPHATSKRFLDDPKAFEAAFARAWFKLTHRDLGPRARYLGPELPADELAWQDPVPATDGKPIGAADITRLNKDVLASGLTVPERVRTAWAGAPATPTTAAARARRTAARWTRPKLYVCECEP